MKTEMHTSEPLVLEPSSFEVEITIEKLSKIPAELFQAGENIICSEIHKLNNFIWDKEGLPQQWKGSIILHIYEKGDKMTIVIIEEYQFYQLRTKFLSSFLASRLTPYVDEITGERQYGFRCNRSTTDQIFCIRQITVERMEV
jgi:hypothetical protein